MSATHVTRAALRPSSANGASHESTQILPLTSAIDRTRRWLLSRQQSDGHWVGELQGDTILESEYVLLLAFLGREREAVAAKAAKYILSQQMPEGGWSNYPGGPADVSVTTKAYFALKLTGHDPEASYMRRARAVVQELGGAESCNSFTRFYLALLGQFPYANCPAVPPEIVLFPSWAYFNLYAVSSWTRTIVVPLTIFYAHKPVRPLPPESSIPELFKNPPMQVRWPHVPSKRLLTWTNFFLAVDQLIKLAEHITPKALRGLAVKKAEKWMVDHLKESDGLGAIFPPMIYTVISLRCLGYADESPEMGRALKQLEDLIIEESGMVRLQPCFSPVWDTALSLNALADAGVNPNHSAVMRSVRWLLDKEVRQPGDWSLANPGVEPGGWFFEYRNPFYPDTDDTAMVLMALAKLGRSGEPAAHRGMRWLLAMQNSDGGWAAFDRNINREILTKIPFADHNAMLDPSCPDITARVLEALGYFRLRPGTPAVDRAIRFLEATQNNRGCWIGRWGVNYIYGTWQVLTGLKSIGFDMGHPMVRRAVAWLKRVQQPSGAWGESCQSYDDPKLAGHGNPTASQTAWALMGLLAAGEASSESVRTGIEYLVATQEWDGSWAEEEFTGTGFPRVFYLKYHLYALYFPLMALARYRAAVGDSPKAMIRRVGESEPTKGRAGRPAAVASA